MSDVVDLRSLLDAREKGDLRTTTKHIICLDPSIADELVILREQEGDLMVTDLHEDDAQRKDVRLGGNPKLAKVRKQIAALEARMRDTSVVAVFRAPTGRRIDELLAEFKEKDVAQADQDRRIITESFAHFERDGERVPDTDFGRADLDRLLELMSKGEVRDLAQNVTTNALRPIDVPFSVRESLMSRK